MSNTLAITLTWLALLMNCHQPSHSSSEQTLYISNHLEEPVIVAVAQTWVEVPGQSICTVQLQDVVEQNENVLSIDVATSALEPSFARRMFVRLPESGHVELYIGGYRPPTEYERNNATPARPRDRPRGWNELFKIVPCPSEQEEEWSQLIVATSDPVLETMCNSVGMKFVRVPPGQFLMGCPENEPGCNATERQHTVTLTNAYWLATTEVTQEQWSQVMESNPRAASEPNLPVHSVTWFEAVEFCERLSKLEGRQYRLPTEAEWEYACRAGTSTAYSFGDSARLLSRYGWYNRNARGEPQPVATKRPNPWGFYDMHGNVLEWCADWASWRYPLEKQINPTGPAGPSSNVLTAGGRVGRGGRCDFYAGAARSAARDFIPPDVRGNSLGFRVVLESGISPSDNGGGSAKPNDTLND